VLLSSTYGYPQHEAQRTQSASRGSRQWDPVHSGVKDRECMSAAVVAELCRQLATTACLKARATLCNAWSVLSSVCISCIAAVHHAVLLVLQLQQQLQ
jgi:hypothetical protein